MSAIIESNRDGVICGFCFEEFKEGEKQFTHVGGEGHDGFHKECLKNWVVVNPTCPIDWQPIDLNSLFSRSERIMARLRPVLVNAAYAAFFGAAVAAAAAGAGAAAEAAKVALTGTRAQVALTDTRAQVVLLGAAAAVHIAGAEVVGAVREVAVMDTAVTSMAALLVGFGLTAAAGILAGVEVTGKERRVIAAAGIAAAGIAAEAAAGIVARMAIGKILDSRGVDLTARQNIGVGMCIGAAGASSASLLISESTPLMFIAITSLVGGGGAGILSLINRP